MLMKQNVNNDVTKDSPIATYMYKFIETDLSIFLSK